MKMGLTEMVFILYRSGSMYGLEEDTLGGFKSMIEKQKKEEGEAYVSTVLFNDEQAVIHDRVPLSEVREMTLDDYYTCGTTALLDAVGLAIRHIANVHRYAREEDRPEKTIFVIMTDGLENASRRYGYHKVKAMISHEQEKYGWEFLFLGANMDAVGMAEKVGIRRDRAVRFHNDEAGVALNYGSVAEAVTTFRAAGVIEESWSAAIEADYKGRQKGSKRGKK